MACKCRVACVAAFQLCRNPRRVNDTIEPHSLMASLPDFNSCGTAVVDPFPTASRSTATTGRHNKDRRPSLPQRQCQLNGNSTEIPQQIDSINTEESCWVQNLRNFPRIARIKADLNNATNSPTEIEIVSPTFSMSFASMCACARCDTVPLTIYFCCGNNV